MSNYIVKTVKKEEYILPIIDTSSFEESVSEFKDRLLKLIQEKGNPNAFKEQLTLISKGKILDNNSKMKDSDPKSMILHINLKIAKALEKKEEEKKNIKNTESSQNTNSSTTSPSNTIEYTPNVRPVSIPFPSGSLGNTLSASGSSTRPMINPFSSGFTPNNLTFGTTDSISLLGIGHQNDAHVANMFVEILNSNENTTNIIKNTEYFKNLTPEQQNDIIEDLENNTITKNIQNIVTFLITKHNNRISSTTTSNSSSETESSSTVSGASRIGLQAIPPNLNSEALSFLQALSTIMNGADMGEIDGEEELSEEQIKEDIESIKAVVGGSFTDEEIKGAYMMCNCDVQLTVNYLLG